MNKEFTLIRKDVKDEIVKDRFKSNWWLITLAILYVLATIGALAYAIYASLNILIFVSIACFVVGVTFIIIWSLSVIKSNNNLLEILFRDKDSKALEVDILEDRLLVSDNADIKDAEDSEDSPIEHSYLTITKIKHTNNYTMIFFDKTTWLIIPNNVLYSEEIDYVVTKSKSNKSKK